mmetsp:Transcript_4249/g.13712  ORF Transcript_4249/g.13712 Transcript_4249/m.13712 type:complete len:270 (+) Transcript_4249:717-1526(+)
MRWGVQRHASGARLPCLPVRAGGGGRGGVWGHASRSQRGAPGRVQSQAARRGARTTSQGAASGRRCGTPLDVPRAAVRAAGLPASAGARGTCLVHVLRHLAAQIARQTHVDRLFWYRTDGAGRAGRLRGRCGRSSGRFALVAVEGAAARARGWSSRQRHGLLRLFILVRVRLGVRLGCALRARVRRKVASCSAVLEHSARHVHVHDERDSSKVSILRSLQTKPPHLGADPGDVTHAQLVRPTVLARCRLHRGRPLPACARRATSALRGV